VTIRTALIDANVFYSMTLTDIIIQSARDGIFRARWTDTIHSEWINALLRNKPNLSRPAIDRRRNAMDRAVPNALITGFEPIIETVTLPHPNDRHVLAAAIRGGCPIILTFNLKHFPEPALAPHGIVAVHPDTFLIDMLTHDEEAMLASLVAMRDRLKNPPLTFDERCARMVQAGLPGFAAAITQFQTKLA
jgi:hypothetical protein